jgi:hypothetical protein
MGGLLLIFSMTNQSYAVLTNLVTNGDFEATSTGIIAAPTPGIGSQWTTESSNGFDVVGQAQRDAPANGADAVATGNTLEIRGGINTGTITLTLMIPLNVVPGANNATLDFDSFSRDMGIFWFWGASAGTESLQSTGRYRVQVSGGNTSDTGQVTVNNTSGNWTANSIPLSVASGDTVTVTFSETGSTTAPFFRNYSPGPLQAGLRIDDVQLLVDIAAVSTVPEPAHIGVSLLALLMGSSLVKKFRRATSR